MSVNELKVDYPEHLNPFRQRRNTLAGSFRGIKKAIVRSFTSKDKVKPTIRPKPAADATTIRNVMSMPPEYAEPQVLLPRSRFSERLNQTDVTGTASVRGNSSIANVESNPFDDGVKSKSKSNITDNSETASPPKSTPRKYRKRKKKAPIPPGSGSESVNGSKWSLVSSESEMSSICYSESEIDYLHNKNVNGENEEILKITREIAKFAEDTNNNTICDETQNKNKCKSDENIAFNSGGIKDDKSDVNDNYNENIQSTTAANQHQDMYIKVTEVSIVVNNSDQENLNSDKITSKGGAIDSNKFDHTLVSPLETSINDSGFAETDEKLIQPSYNDSSKEKLEVLEQGSSVRSEEQEKEKDPQLAYKTVPEEKEKDPQLAYKTVPDSMETKLSVKGTVDFIESMYASPTPKVRKNILTKEELLGSE